MLMYQRLSAIKVEIEALMRLIADNTKTISIDSLQQLTTRQYELLETIWAQE